MTESSTLLSIWKKRWIAVSGYEDTEDGYQIDGLTLETIVVLEFPPSESCQDMIMSQRKQRTHVLLFIF